MRKKNEKREIKKDQLLPNWDFIRFCNDDPANSYVGGRMEVNEQLLRAAEKDELIRPILQVEEKVRQADGREKKGLVNYYSPHQIYILAELEGNSVNADGYLDDLNTKGVKVSGQELRFIKWGGGAFSANSSRRNVDDDDIVINAYKVSDYLYSFLQLLHSLEPIPRHLQSEERQRYWSKTPILEYDLEPLKVGGKKLLKIYGLDEKKLIILRRNIGQFAEVRDPLAHWYYYIKRHPEWKKYLLKGDASLAQEIYRLYDLLTEVWEVIIKEKSEPIFEFLYKDFGTPSYAPKTEYLHGEDTKALLYAIQQFKKWKLKKANKLFVNDEVNKKIVAVEKELTDYEKRYDERSYAGNVRKIYEEDKIKLEDLDEKTRWYVDNTLAQIKDANIKEEIANAISHRLSDLQRELSDIFWNISSQFRDRENAAWQKINGNNLWVELGQEGKFENLDRVQQIELVRKELKKIEEEAKDWKEKSREFHQTVSWFADIVFCKSCREKPVRQHSENPSNMWEINRSLICDDCLKNASEHGGVKGEEWYCEHCGKLLYKFVAHNLINDVLINTANAKIQLEYGKITISARCPDKSCKRENKGTINWGWLP